MAWTASSSALDFGAGPLGWATSPMAPAASASMPVRTIRFIERTPWSLLRNLLEELAGLLLGFVGSALQLKNAVEQFCGLLLFIGGDGEPAEINQVPTFDKRLGVGCERFLEETLGFIQRAFFEQYDAGQPVVGTGVHRKLVRLLEHLQEKPLRAFQIARGVCVFGILQRLRGAGERRRRGGLRAMHYGPLGRILVELHAGEPLVFLDHV